jgi:hypothetical protein
MPILELFGEVDAIKACPLKKAHLRHERKLLGRPKSRKRSMKIQIESSDMTNNITVTVFAKKPIEAQSPWMDRSIAQLLSERFETTFSASR